MTVYDATSIEAAAKVAEEYPSREWADIPIIQGIAKAIRALPGSPIPTPSDAIGETVEKLREALEDRTRVACGDWCTEDRHDAGCIAARALLTALEQRGDGWLPIESAPHACHVLAIRFDEAFGEWISAVVMSPPSFPFTHWRPLPTPPLPMKED